MTVREKETLFQQLVDLLAAAEQPVTRRWYESTWREGQQSRDAQQGREAAAAAVDEWCGFVGLHLDFIFHAADTTTLPVPTSLQTRVLRQCALIDSELTKQLCAAVLQRVLLFAPESASRDPQLQQLRAKFDGAIGRLTKPAAA